jgi:hypothetical protein
MLNLQVIRGDSVAILPFSEAPADRVIAIATVRIVNSVFVQLTDGRIYSSMDGRGLTPTSEGCIVPATEEHRNALMATRYSAALDA